jgi:glycosyltransferase involved in cell wall biosynthesis
LRDYAKYLIKIVEDERIGDHVSFLGKLPRSQLADVYRNHDVLVFPSIWDEPFSIALLEAMACGMAVVGTTTGGTGEILVDGENGLTVPPENVEALSEAMEEMVANPHLRWKIGQRAGELVDENFTIDIMVDKIERFLKNV